MRQHATPIIVDSVDQPRQIMRMHRLRRSTKAGPRPHFLENLLQTLVHEQPGALPVEEIEPAFRQLHAVCQELKFNSANCYADNLLINPDGRICLVECKLWHNPEAVREVVGQILSYASELARLSYDDLTQAVRQALKQQTGDPIIERVLGPEAAEEDCEALIDGIARSLRIGNFLLLVVGDGIRSGVQQIVKLLQNATLGFSFGLIEMAIYGNQSGNGPFYIQPRILARTEIITRTVFIAGSEIQEPQIARVPPGGRPQSLSDKEFFDDLAKADSHYPDQVRAFFERCKEIGCEPQLRRKYVLYADDSLGGRINLGSIRRDGFVEIWGSAAHDAQYREPIGRHYMEQLVSFVKSASINDVPSDPASWQIRYQGRVAIPLKEMLEHQEAWLAAIQEVISRFTALETSAAS